jgi:hypothetical protein
MGGEVVLEVSEKEKIARRQERNTNTGALEQLSQQRHFRSLCGPGHVRSRVNTDV